MGDPSRANGEAFDPGSELCIVSWNVHKLLHDGVHDELQDMVDLRGPYLLALHEARLEMAIPSGMGGCEFRKV